jgi:hypothetical protein
MLCFPSKYKISAPSRGGGLQILSGFGHLVILSSIVDKVGYAGTGQGNPPPPDVSC